MFNSVLLYNQKGPLNVHTIHKKMVMDSTQNTLGLMDAAAREGEGIVLLMGSWAAGTMNGNGKAGFWQSDSAKINK